jgi:uncharacterized protein (DUF3084 family)
VIVQAQLADLEQVVEAKAKRISELEEQSSTRAETCMKLEENIRELKAEQDALNSAAEVFLRKHCNALELRRSSAPINCCYKLSST